MWVRSESGRSAHAWQPGDYEPPLSGEPSKKSPMPGEMGAGVALEGGGSVAGLEGVRGTTRDQREEEEGGEGRVIYTGSLPPSLPLFFVSFFVFSLSLSPSLVSFSLHLRPLCCKQFSLSLFNQPPVVFHLAGASLEPTNHHRIPYSAARA